MKHRNDIDFNARLYGKQKFGFRKLSVGLAAVTLGTTFLMTNGELVHADATNNTQVNSQTEEVKNNEANTPAKNEVKSSDTKNQVNNSKNTLQDDQHRIRITSQNQDVRNNQTKDLTYKDEKKQTIFVKDLNASSRVGLEENKTQNSLTITASRNGQQINKTQDMMAGDGTVNVHINIDNPKLNTDHQIIINLPDAGITKNFKVSKSSTKITSNNSQSYWNVNVDVHDYNSKIIATWNSISHDIPQNFKLDLPVQGNDSIIKSSISNQSFNIEVNGQVQTAFTANLTPYKEKVIKGEILKGFPMGEKTFNSVNGSWPEKNNMSEEDINKYSLNDNSKILQWGIYFNYGNQSGNTNLKPLLDAVFKAYFDGDQTLIPSSIKVFEVPSGMAVDNNGYRDGVDNFYIDPNDQTQNEKYYNKITGNQNNERSAFEQYLRDHVTYSADKPNGFSVDQTNDPKNANGHVLFHIPYDTTHDYSKHAYFIQLDTVMKDNKKPGDGTRINYEASQGLDGKGKQSSTANSWLKGISGSSDSRNQEQIKYINYEVKYIYKNGTLVSNNPFYSSDKLKIELKSTDNGSTWTEYSLNNDSTWNNIQGENISFSVPETTEHADNKYKIYEDGIFGTKEHDNKLYDIPTSNISKSNNKITITITVSNVEIGDNYIVTVPYYTTEHADVRFIDNNEPKQPKPLDDFLVQKDFTLSETSDNAGKGLTVSTDAHDPTKVLINFGTNLTKIMSTLKDSGYKFEKVSDNAKRNEDGSFDFGKFNNDQTKDQHFIIYLVHDTEPQTQTATITENVVYYYENGPHATTINNPTKVPSDQQLANGTRTVTFERTVKIDKITKNIIVNSETSWSFKDNNKGDTDLIYNKYAPALKGLDNPNLVYSIDAENISAKNSNPQIISGNITGILSFNTQNMSPDKKGLTYTIYVPYKLHENIHVHYIDEDNNDQEIAESKYSGDPTKDTQNNTPNTIQDFINQGYILDKEATLGDTSQHNGKKYGQFFNSNKNNVNSPTLTFDNDEEPNNQNYFVYLYHSIKHDSEEKTITENIKYIDEATGQEIHNPYHSGTLTFTRDIYTDEVTGTKKASNWSLVEFKPVENPTIPGYTIDPDKITQKLNDNNSALAKINAKEIGRISFTNLSQEQLTALPKSSNIDFVVPYVKNVTPPAPTPEPSNPTEPTTPSQPTQASQPTSPAKPKTPKTTKTPKTPKTTHHKTHTPKKHTTSTFNPRSQHENHKKTTNTVPSKGQNVTVSTKSQNIPTPKPQTMKNNVKNTNSNAPTLPETGEKQNKASTFGLGILALSALLGLAGYKKRRDH